MSDETSIAIIGMSGRFPKAPDLDTFWANLRGGVECFTWFSDAELIAAGASEAEVKDPRYVKGKAVLDGVDVFDAGLFGYNHRDAQWMDPQQRVFLECAHEALEHAGYGPGPGRGPQSVGVYAGSSASSYLLATQDRRGGDEVGAMQQMIGNDKDYLATRVAYKLNLTGPAISVQTACSTSLVAVHMACQSLLGGECGMALAGGVCITFPQVAGYTYEEGGIASPDGHCRPFDADARGTNGGSGVGVVVLKRLVDALADGDTVHAIIRGSAVNNDGGDKVGFTAPSQTGQARVIAEALALADVPASSIGYVEAHGTATPVGDPIEVAALTQAFRESTQGVGYCALGSVKSNFGHLDAAAGVAGLIKAALALAHGEIPPSLNYRRPNPKIPFAQSPFYVAAQATPWPVGLSPRRAGVSSFGIGGTNAHIVMEEGPRGPLPAVDGPALLVFSAKTAGSLQRLVARFADYFEARPQVRLADVAFTLQVGRGAWDYRRAIVAHSFEEAARLLREPFEPRKASHARDTAPGDDLPAVARRWENGGAVDWAALPRSVADPRRVPLPTYAFERQRCWLDPQRSTEAVPPVGPDCLYAPRWVPAGAPDAPLGLRGIVLFDPGTAQADGLAREFERRGCTVTRVLPAGPLPDAAALDAADAVVYAWTLAPAAECAGADGLEASFHGLMRLGQALSELHRTAPLRLMILADGIADVLPGERIRPTQACVLGAVRELPRELPWLACRCVDIAPTVDPATVVDALLTECGDSLTALRGTDRYTWTMERLDGAAPAPSVPPLRTRGVYWIVGGFGGVGRGLARHLASRHQARLILSSRSALGEAPACLPVERLRGRLSALQSASGIVPVASRPGLSELLTEYSAALVFEFFQSAGPGDEGFLPAGLRQRLNVQPAFGRFFDFMTGLLESTGLVASEGGRLRIVRTPQAPAQVRSRIEGAHAGFGGMLDFIEHCARHYSQVFSGSLPGISVLYPDGSPERMERAVAQTVEHSTVRIQLELLSETVGELANACTGSPFRILEVGAGHGIVADAVLPGLRGDAEYWFTDIGRTFVDRRRQAAAAAGEDRIITATLDIARDPLRQGFQAGQFDIVVAMNVVHATAHVGRTLVNLRKLLKPGGTLILLETVRREPWVDLVWGLAPGWWDYQDFRTGSPLLDVGQWREVFAGAGLSGFVALPEAGVDGFAHDAALLLARKPARRDAGDHRAFVAELEQAGAEVLALQADVADEPAMRDVLAQARARFGTVNGVFHCALALDDRLLTSKTRRQAEHVLRPKIDGTLVLDRVLAAAPPEFLVLFSSLAAFDPAPGQFDYAAASAFMDAYARSRAGGGCRVVSINWNRWRDSGFSARLALAEPDPDADRLVLLSAAAQWFLDEHRIAGLPVVPGTALLEQAVLAGQGAGLRYPLKLRDMQLTAPCVVPEGAERTLAVRIRALDGTGDHGFELATDVPHARGVITGVDTQPVVHDLKVWRRDCAVSETTDAADRPAALGLRWQCLQWMARDAAGERAIAELRLHESFSGDLRHHPLHPALVDVALGFCCSGDSMPAGYERVTVYGPLPGHVYSLASIRVEGGDRLVDAVITDAAGREIVRVEGYRLRAAKRNRRLVQGEAGRLETLHLEAVTREPPGADEVEIEVFAAGLNFKDVLLGAGLLPVDGQVPPVFGAECAGRIVRVGTAAGNWKVGDAVVAATAGGALVDFALAKAAHVFPKPPSLSYAAAAAVPVAFATAWHALKTVARITAGQRVLIHAAAGGVGLAAVHIARQAGAEVFATAGNEQKRDYLRSLGVRLVMDSRSRRFAQEVREQTQGAGMDVVLNSLSGDLMLAGLECVAPGGLFLELGKREILGGGSLPLALFNRGIGFFAIELSPGLPGYRGAVELVLQALADGSLAPLPNRIFAMEEAGEAFQSMLAARHIGKLVIAPEPARAERLSVAGQATTVVPNEGDGLSDEEGLRILDIALGLPVSQVVVSPDGNPLRPHLPAGLVAAPVVASVPQVSQPAPAAGNVAQTLTVIWCEALGLDQVGLDDDFFDLLGDSLLAIEVLAKVREQLNVALPASTLFTSSTIRELTALIESKAPKPPRPLPAMLVPLTGVGGKGTPLYLAPPILGTLFPYVPLAQMLGGARPVIGLVPRGSQPGEEPFRTLPEIAAWFVEGIRSYQEQGPYLVAGWSFGATLAYEIGHQLEAQGQTVAFLAPIDLPAPGSASSGMRDFLRFFGGSMLRGTVSYFRDYLYLKSGAREGNRHGHFDSLIERAVIAQVIPPEARQSFARQPDMRRIMGLYRANMAAMAAYHLKTPCKARIDLFRTPDHSRQHSEALGWEKATAGGVIVHRMPADHMTILRPPFAAELAAAMDARLRELKL